MSGARSRGPAKREFYRAARRGAAFLSLSSGGKFVKEIYGGRAGWELGERFVHHGDAGIIESNVRRLRGGARGGVNQTTSAMRARKHVRKKRRGSALCTNRT